MVNELLYIILRASTYRVARVKRLLINLNPYIHVGKGSIIEHGAILRAARGGRIRIGKNCYVSSGAQLITHGGDIVAGDNCTFNPCCVVYGQGGVVIGNGVRIAAHCTIVPANHVFSDPNVPIFCQGMNRKGIVIHDDVWLGSGVKVLDGVTIGHGCVVGANAVVTRSTDDFGVYIGVPARKIKSRLDL